jgi:putative membrane protein
MALPLTIAVVGYLAGVHSERGRGRAWPVRRACSWLAGVAVAGAAPLVGGVEALDPLVAHMAMHLLAGMLAPLLLVLGAPVTLALRTLPLVPARRLARLLRSRPVAAITHPIVAAALTIAPLWWLMQPATVGGLQTNPLLHAFVVAHFLLAGYLFTASIVGIDPSPHRAGFPLRAAVLVGSIAVHGILAKLLVARSPGEVPAAELEAAARLMYTGGDVLELALAAVFCAQWYRSARPRRRTSLVAHAT